MATLDGGGIEVSGVNALDGGAVSQTGTEVVNPYGVTVQHVRNLASHVGFDPALDDPDFGPSKKQVTDVMIAHWIQLVTDSVAARLASLARFQADSTRWAVITGSARTAITNGAASYLVAAAFPAKAGTNDQSSYSAELWNRYLLELGQIVDLGLQFDKDDTGGTTANGGVQPMATANRPSVEAGSGFFATDPYNRDPYYDPNRMNPRTGGYPAPGAEGTGYRW